MQSRSCKTGSVLSDSSFISSGQVSGSKRTSAQIAESEPDYELVINKLVNKIRNKCFLDGVESQVLEEALYNALRPQEDMESESEGDTVSWSGDEGESHSLSSIFHPPELGGPTSLGSSGMDGSSRRRS